MKIFDILNIMSPNLRPEESKIHLATWNGTDDPMDVYLAGKFNEWQCWQTRKNFPRRFVISLINMSGSGKWLFAGAHNSAIPQWIEEKKEYWYELTEIEDCSEMNGRMIASFQRPGRQSYLNAENWIDDILVSEIRSQQLTVGDFPGFRCVNLTREELELIVRHSLISWRTALSSVAGVYLISDTESGKLYVGSASGEGGIWQRWSCYAADGHGGNVELQRLIDEGNSERANKFRYSILEIADIHTGHQDILDRESHWKDVLMSRKYGLNRN